MTGTEFVEVALQAFVVGAVVGALAGIIKTMIHNALN